MNLTLINLFWITFFLCTSGSTSSFKTTWKKEPGTKWREKLVSYVENALLQLQEGHTTWEHFLRIGMSQTKLDDNNHRIYTFLKDMKLSFVFETLVKVIMDDILHFPNVTILQRNTFISLDIGGISNFKFGLRAENITGGIVKVVDANENQVEFAKVFEALNSLKGDNISRILLSSLDSRLDDQPFFTGPALDMGWFLVLQIDRIIPFTVQRWNLFKEANSSLRANTSTVADAWATVKQAAALPTIGSVKDVLRQVVESRISFYDAFGERLKDYKHVADARYLNSFLSPITTNMDNIYNHVPNRRHNDVKDLSSYRLMWNAIREARREGEEEFFENLAHWAFNDFDKKRNAFCHETRRKRSTACSSKYTTYEIEEGSEHIDKEQIEFIVRNTHDKSLRHRFVIQIDENQMVHERYMDYNLKRGVNTRNDDVNITDGTSSINVESLISYIHKQIGLSELIRGFAATENMVNSEEKLRGAMFVSTSLHYEGKPTDLIKSVKKMFKLYKSLRVVKAVEKTQLPKKIGNFLSKIVHGKFVKLSTTFKGFKTLMKKVIPVINIITDGIALMEDFEDLADVDADDPLLPLKIIHLELDVAILILDFMGPEMEPIALAVSIFRMAIDSIYINVFRELEKVNWNSPWAPLEAAARFLFGVVKGIVDFLTGGLLSGLAELNEEVERNRKLLKSLTDPTTFYSIHKFDANGTAIDFTNGTNSFYGGSVDFELFDSGRFKFTIEQIPKLGKGTRTLTWQFTPSGKIIDSIVLGVGESREFRYKQKTAKLLWFIPVKSAFVICGEDLFQETLHGTYHGNNANNTFVAMQEVPDLPAKESCDYGRLDTIENMQKYFYRLYGEGGDDKFFIGPQSADIVGGEGSDMYVIQHNGRKVVINNFANDAKMDTLYLNVSFLDLVCNKIGFDLHIEKSNSAYKILVKQYFRWNQDQNYKHLTFRSGDGIVFDTGYIKTDLQCVARVIDRSGSGQGVRIDMTLSHFLNVTTAVGSKYRDTIIGNEQNNVIESGGGSDTLMGGNGSDTYILRNHSGRDTVVVTINNWALDGKNDVAVINVPFRKISASHKGSDVYIHLKTQNIKHENAFRSGKKSVIQANANVKDDTIVVIKDALKGDEYDHISFVSEDHVTFTVEIHNEAAVVVPQMLDFSSSDSGVVINLEHEKSSFEYSFDVYSLIGTVVDSPFDDILIGNKRSNFFSCSNGTDFMRGNGNADRYVINNGCRGVKINNIDPHEDVDVLFLYAKADDLVLQYEPNLKSLVIHVLIGERDITIQLLHWFKSEKYQHMLVQLSDGTLVKLPEEHDEIHEFEYRPLVLEMNNDPFCENGKFTLDTSMKKYRLLTRIHFEFSNCSYTVYGNGNDNFFHLGPSSKNSIQYVSGSNGTDTYDVGGGDGIIVIDNFASDNITDHLKLGIIYDYVKIVHCNESGTNNITLSSKSRLSNTLVVIQDYCTSEEYQHLNIHTSDGVLFNISGDRSHKVWQVYQMDYSHADVGYSVSLYDNIPTRNTSYLYGSLKRPNNLEGNAAINKILGGNLPDILFGHDNNDWLDGQDADDVIYGGTGKDMILGGNGDDVIHGDQDDDALYPGNGADIIDGSHGVDVVVLKGNVFKKQGVFVNLDEGFGLHADAQDDLYVETESVVGTDFDDILVGSSTHNNSLFGYFGDDTLVPLTGHDVLAGGEGSDSYILSGATGRKEIENYALDELYDTIVVDDVDEKDLCAYRHAKHLNFAFLPSNLSTTWLERSLSAGNNRLDVSVLSWYENSTDRHTHVQLRDGLVADVYERFKDLNDIDNFTTSLYNETGLQAVQVGDSASVTWNSDIQNITQLCACNLYMGYKNPADKEYTMMVVEHGKNHVTLDGRHDLAIILLMGKCGLLVSYSSTIMYQPANEIWMYLVTVGVVVLGFAVAGVIIKIKFSSSISLAKVKNIFK